MDHPELFFDFEYAGTLRNCKAVMHDTFDRIYFDGEYIADICMDDQLNWILFGGTILPAETVEELGQRIEGRSE